MGPTIASGVTFSGRHSLSFSDCRRIHDHDLGWDAIDREFSSPINMDGHKIVAALRSVAEHSHDLEEHKEEDERDQTEKPKVLSAKAARAVRRSKIRERRRKAAAAKSGVSVGAGEAGRTSTAAATSKVAMGPKSKTKPRALGVGVEVSLNIILASKLKCGRVIVCTGGPPSIGPGSLPAAAAAGGSSAAVAAGETVIEEAIASQDYFSLLGHEAMRLSACIDVFCGGPQGFGVQFLQPLCHCNGGTLSLAPAGFDSPAFGRGVRAALVRRVDSTRPIEEGIDAAGERTAASSSTMERSVLVDVRCSRSLQCSRVIGQAFNLTQGSSISQSSILSRLASVAMAVGSAGAEKASTTGGGMALAENATEKAERLEREAAAAAGRSLRSGTVLRFALGKTDDRQSLSIYFDGVAEEEARRTVGRREEEGEAALVQLVARFVNEAGQVVTQVTTKRLPAASDLSDFLEAVDADAAAILVAKRAVLMASDAASASSSSSSAAVTFQAQLTPEGMAQDEVDAIVHNMAIFFKECSDAASWPPPPTSTLGRIARLLHRVRQGPLLGAQLQHPDDIAALRVAMLGAAVAPAVRMLLPLLTCVGVFASSGVGVGSVTTVQPELASLRSGCIILADCDSDVFVWAADDVAEALENAAGGKTSPQAATAMAIMKVCLHFVEDAIVGERFPAPRVHVLRKGESMGRRLRCRLAGDGGVEELFGVYAAGV